MMEKHENLFLSSKNDITLENVAYFKRGSVNV